MIHVAALGPVLKQATFNYFDIVVLVWLIIGLFVGRKRGMSQEMLPLLQWLGIVVLAGVFYWPFSQLVKHYAMFTTLWSCVTAYLLIAVGVHVLYLWIKQMLGEKLVEKDPFGRAEFYLGMTAGVIRFACMLLVGMSLMNSRVETAAELAQTEKFQAANFSDIRFPTYGELQQDVLFKSVTGKLVEGHLKRVLIASETVAPSKQVPTLAQRRNDTIDQILAQPSKR
ncbi:MAG TPA: CvpA family protein [Verrucomicrobiae bacterium]|jgi:uncharacterized membrane protein required for colicin V production